MAKEMKQNFGARSKNAPKAGSGVGSACGQNSSSWGVSAIPPINNGSQDMMINPGNFSDVTNHGNNGPLHEGNMDHYNDYSNNSSTQSNSNSEFSDINEPSVPGPGASSASAQVFRQQKIQQPRYYTDTTLYPKIRHYYNFFARSNSSTTPKKPNKNGAENFVAEDPYGPMSSHFYHRRSQPQQQKMSSHSVLTSPVANR